MTKEQIIETLEAINTELKAGEQLDIAFLLRIAIISLSQDNVKEIGELLWAIVKLFAEKEVAVGEKEKAFLDGEVAGQEKVISKLKAVLAEKPDAWPDIIDDL